MLKVRAATASIVVCSTCRFSKGALMDAHGRHGGELFGAALRGVLAGHACRDRVEIQPMPCLFACSNHCTVFLRSERRLGYVLGGFEPSPVHAAVLLDYVHHYLQTDDGVVAYAKWPAGVKGHFLVRVPPDGVVWTSP